MSISRRHFLAMSAAGVATGFSSLSRGQVSSTKRQIIWHDVRDWGVEGKGWTETAKYFDRLPAKAEQTVPPNVWKQSRHSAGMLTRFRTTAQEIWTEHVVGGATLATPDLASIGYSGLDLYATDPKGNWKWLSVTRPRAPEMKGAIISGLAHGERSYQLYLPLYNSTEVLKIGVPEGEEFSPIEPRREQSIVFYGTSITQGASASRPGRCHTAILGRQLDLPVINLGFGGAGRMEKEVGDLLIELDPRLYVIDCLPNMQGPEVAQRAAPLVRQIRAAHPKTPIVLVEDRTYSNTSFIPARQREQEANRAALQEAYRVLQAEGVNNLWYITGDQLLGDDQEGTSDSSHPTDLGFWRQANVFEPVLRAALKMGP